MNIVYRMLNMPVSLLEVISRVIGVIAPVIDGLASTHDQSHRLSMLDRKAG